MGSNTRIVGLALWAGLMGWQTAAAETQIPARPTVRVQLTVLAGVPADTLERAKAEALRLFERSQMSLEWVDASACEARCLFVRVIAKPIGTKSRNRLVVGVAPGTREARGTFAWVFFDRIQVYSAELQLDLSLMLAHVIVHELGHLLLPHGAHSVAGVMRPEWDRAQVRNAAEGLLTFTPDQAALIRARLQNVSETTAHR